ncbi:MAG: hypothetical protein U1F09_16695 [Steroidobacteraceae bacterium]
MPWAQQVRFLDDPVIVKDSRKRIGDAARAIGNHPAVLAIFVGNETPPDIVRWHGPEAVQKFLRSLHDAAKEQAPETLVSYANYPPTEYLDLDFDFSFNVYLHREADFRRYLMRLQNLAEDRPPFLSEFGMDSIREGAEHQAETLGWQVRAAFELGASPVACPSSRGPTTGSPCRGRRAAASRSRTGPSGWWTSKGVRRSHRQGGAEDLQARRCRRCRRIRR